MRPVAARGPTGDAERPCGRPRLPRAEGARFAARGSLSSEPIPSHRSSRHVPLEPLSARTRHRDSRDRRHGHRPLDRRRCPGRSPHRCSGRPSIGLRLRRERRGGNRRDGHGRVHRDTDARRPNRGSPTRPAPTPRPAPPTSCARPARSGSPARSSPGRSPSPWSATRSTSSMRPSSSSSRMRRGPTSPTVRAWAPSSTTTRRRPWRSATRCSCRRARPATPSFATVDVTLSAPSGLDVSVDWATADGTATVADSDYVAGAGQLDFAPGETSTVVLIQVIGDVATEGDETFDVDLVLARQRDARQCDRRRDDRRQRSDPAGVRDPRRDGGVEARGPLGHHDA